MKLPVRISTHFLEGFAFR